MSIDLRSPYARNFAIGTLVERCDCRGCLQHGTCHFNHLCRCQHCTKPRTLVMVPEHPVIFVTDRIRGVGVGFGLAVGTLSSVASLPAWCAFAGLALVILVILSDRVRPWAAIVRSTWAKASYRLSRGIHAVKTAILPLRTRLCAHDESPRDVAPTYVTPSSESPIGWNGQHKQSCATEHTGRTVS